MNFKPEIKEISLIDHAFSKSVSEIVQGDVIVPDVLEDVGKILTADADAVIESKEISGGRITVSGTVSADILYVPQSGGIEAIHTVMSFSHSEKTEYENLNLSAHSRIAAVDCNLYNSRKMNIRTTLGIDISGSRDISCGVLSSAKADCPIELQSTSVTTVPKHITAADVITFRETLDIPSGSPAAASVLRCSAVFSDRDFRLLANKAVIRGNLIITVLYKGEDGELSRAEFTKPVTEITDAPGAEEDMKENISVSLSPFKAEPTANAEGAMRAFMAEGKLFVETECEKCETENVITDMFCTDFNLKLTDSPISCGITEDITMLTAVRDIIPSDEMKAKKIFDVSAKTNIESINISNGEISIGGNAEAEMLVLKNDDTYACINRSIPFTYSGTWDNPSPEVTAEAKGVSAVLTGAGDAEIRFTAALTAKNRPTKTPHCITNAEISNDGAQSERPSLVVYYTKPGDTLWNIAKRYGVTRKNIENANNIGDVLADGQKIIIPR